MPIVWKNEYSVGVDQIDHQHKQLISIINALELTANLSTARPDYRAKIEDVFNKLVSYTQLHFATEEAMMGMFDYPGMAEHKMGHDAFVEMVSDKKALVVAFMDAGDMSKAKTQLESVLMFLTRWLVEHIQRSDKEYTTFFLDIKKKAKKSGWWSFGS